MNGGRATTGGIGAGFTRGLHKTARALREAIGRRPVTVQVAGAPGELAALVAPEALPGFTRLAAGNGWRNEISSSGLYGVAR